MAALGGLSAYLDLAQVIGLSKSVQKQFKVRTGAQGRTDAQMVLVLVLPFPLLLHTGHYLQNQRVFLIFGNCWRL